MFPNPFRVVLYGTDATLEGTRLDGVAERIEFVVLPVHRTDSEVRDWQGIADGFTVEAANDWWVLYRRVGPLPPPPPP